MRRLLVAAVLALLLVGGLVWHANAQVVPRHFACYAAAESTPHKTFRYLPNGTDPCPFGWQKIDWIDD